MFRGDRGQIVHDLHRKLAVTVQVVDFYAFDAHLLTPGKLLLDRFRIVRIKNMFLIKLVHTIPKNQVDSLWLGIRDKFFYLRFIITPKFPSKIHQAVPLPCFLCVIDIIKHRIKVDRI